MDTTTISLLFGSLGAGLFWWGAQTLVRRCSGKVGKAHPASHAEEQNTSACDAPWDKTALVYRKILYMRLAGFVLCLFAAGSLLLHAGTGIAVFLAGAGLSMQYFAYRTRTTHVFSVKKAVENQFLEKIKDTNKTAYNDKQDVNIIQQ